MQIMGKGQHRRHTNAAAKKQGHLGRRIQFKMIDGFGDKNAPPGLENSVHQVRPPPSLGLLQDCNFITAAIGRVTAHGILPHILRRNNNIQMRSRRPSRQIPTIYRHKPIFLNRTRAIFHLGDRHLQNRRFVIILVKMQMIPGACSRFRLINLCCDHGLIGRNSSFSVHRRGIGVWVRRQRCRINRQSLILIF